MLTQIAKAFARHGSLTLSTVSYLVCKYSGVCGLYPVTLTLENPRFENSALSVCPKGS